MNEIFNVILADLPVTLTAGIVSGIVASLCYALIKKLISPKVKIDPEIIVHPTEKVVFVKIINRSRVKLNELKAELTYYKSRHSNCESSIIPPLRGVPFSVDKYRNDKDVPNSQSTYAVVLRFDYSKLNGITFDHGDRLVFSFRASHSFSNTIKYFNQEFYCSDSDQVKVSDKLKFVRANNTGVE